MATAKTLLFVALMAIGAQVQGAVDLDALARNATVGAKNPTDKVMAAVKWTHAHMSWTYTDYQERTVEQIVERKGGNCNEQALVIQEILGRVGVKNRRIREINIQPRSVERKKSADALVVKMGTQASVFGLQHNDHVWIEYWDDLSGQWQPADPTIGVIGIKQWELSRVSFEPRGKSAVIPLRDMLVPIGIVALTGDDTHPFENRTQRYLIEGFATYVRNAEQSPQWSRWVREVTAEQPHIEGAFAGRYNLGEDDSGEIDQLRQTYENMKAWSERRKPGS